LLGTAICHGSKEECRSTSAKAKLLSESSAAAAASAAASAASASVVADSNLNTCSLFSKIFREINGDEWDEQVAAGIISGLNSDYSYHEMSSYAAKSNAAQSAKPNESWSSAFDTVTDKSLSSSASPLSSEQFKGQGRPMNLNDCCPYFSSLEDGESARTDMHLESNLQKRNSKKIPENFFTAGFLSSSFDIKSSELNSSRSTESSSTTAKGETDSNGGQTFGLSSMTISTSGSSSGENCKSNSPTSLKSLSNCFGREVSDKVIESAVEAEYAMLATAMCVQCTFECNVKCNLNLCPLFLIVFNFSNQFVQFRQGREEQTESDRISTDGRADRGKRLHSIAKKIVYSANSNAGRSSGSDRFSDPEDNQANEEIVAVPQHVRRGSSGAAERRMH
jgi:hypothetical protein